MSRTGSDRIGDFPGCWQLAALALRGFVFLLFLFLFLFLFLASKGLRRGIEGAYAQPRFDGRPLPARTQHGSQAPHRWQLAALALRGLAFLVFPSLFPLRFLASKGLRRGIEGTYALLDLDAVPRHRDCVTHTAPHGPW